MVASTMQMELQMLTLDAQIRYLNGDMMRSPSEKIPGCANVTFILELRYLEYLLY